MQVPPMLHAAFQLGIIGHKKPETNKAQIPLACAAHADASHAHLAAAGEALVGAESAVHWILRHIDAQPAAHLAGRRAVARWCGAI
jgi:hypothetical protein